VDVLYARRLLVPIELPEEGRLALLSYAYLLFSLRVCALTRENFDVSL